MNRYPRVTIEFCTQCRWMLRAAYFAQELLSTFSTALGEVALQPATGGRFVPSSSYSAETGGYAGYVGRGSQTKVLKQLVRDVIQPQRDLGHSDKKGHKKAEATESATSAKGREDVENGTANAIDTHETKSEDKPTTVAAAASQFQGAAEACEDCQ